jgi:hypothetical protein
MLGNTQGKRRRMSTAHYERVWSLHLAQGGSVIASTITPVALHAAITEAVEGCVFRTNVTGRFGMVTGDFGNVTEDFGNVTERTGRQDWRCA